MITGFPFFLIGPLLLILLVLVLLFLLSKRRAAREIGQIPIYSEQCGGQMGLFKATWPFIRLTLYEDFLVISGCRKTIIEYSKIRWVDTDGLTDLEISTSDKDTYGEPTLYSFNSSYVAHIIDEKLKEKGYYTQPEVIHRGRRKRKH